MLLNRGLKILNSVLHRVEIASVVTLSPERYHPEPAATSRISTSPFTEVYFEFVKTAFKDQSTELVDKIKASVIELNLGLVSGSRLEIKSSLFTCSFILTGSETSNREPRKFPTGSGKSS